MPLSIACTHCYCLKNGQYDRIQITGISNLKSGHNWHLHALPRKRKNYKGFSSYVKSFSFYRKISFSSTASTSIKASATVTTSPENALEDFLGWAIANGVEGLDGEKSKIGLFIGKNGERGITATAPLRRNETFAKIPLRLAITDDPDDEESNTLLGKDTTWSVRLACKLLRLKSQGVNCPWSPYLNSLPTSVPAPLTHFSWEDIQSIAYEPARREVDRTAWMVSSAWTSLPPTAAVAVPTTADEEEGQSSPPPPPTREEFDWAISVVHSRTFGCAGKNGGVGVRMLVPLVDMLNHSGDQNLSPVLAGKNKNKNNIAPPVATATDNVRWDLVSKIGGEFFMVLTTTREIQKGEELLLSYGERNNDDFFLHYGFIPPKNIHDDVILFASIEEAIDWHLGKYIPLGVLAPVQLQEAITSAYTAAMKEENWSGGGGVTNNGGKVSSMEAALDAMPASEAEHIRKERCAIKLLSKGRADGRFVAAIESLHSVARIAGASDVAMNCQDHVREAVAARAVEVLKNMYNTAGMKLEDDLLILVTESGGGGSRGGGRVDDDEHGWRDFAEYYFTAISSSPWKDIIYNKEKSSQSTTSLSSSSSSVDSPLIIDSGLGSGSNEENAALLAALQAAAPQNSNKTASSSGSESESISATSSVSGDVPLLVRQYRAYKAMILWDALLC